MDTDNRHRETHRKHCEQDTAQKHENIKNTIQKAKKMRGPGWLTNSQRVHSTRSASDKVYPLLSHGRWFSLSTPTSSTIKTGRQDIAEILLKVKLNTKSQTIKKR